MKIKISLLFILMSFFITAQTNKINKRTTITDAAAIENTAPDSLLTYGTDRTLNWTRLTDFATKIAPFLLTGTDVWRKSDGLTPADSFTEEIRHNGDLVLNGVTKSLSFDNSIGSSKISNIGISGTIVETRDIAANLVLRGNTGISFSTANPNSVTQFGFSVGSGFVAPTANNHTIASFTRDLSTPASYSVTPEMYGIRVGGTVDFSASPSSNNLGSYSSFYSNPTITNVGIHYALSGNGRIGLSDYGSLSVTGTPTSLAAWDANGNLIETSLINSDIWRDVNENPSSLGFSDLIKHGGTVVVASESGNTFEIGDGTTNGEITFTPSGGTVSVGGTIRFDDQVDIIDHLKFGANAFIESTNNRRAFNIVEPFNNSLGIVSIGATTVIPNSTNPFFFRVNQNATYDDGPQASQELIGSLIDQDFTATTNTTTYNAFKLNPSFTDGVFTITERNGFKYETTALASTNHYAFNADVGKVKLGEYGLGNVIGTATFGLAVDALGNVIETNLFPTLQEVTNQSNTTSNGLILDESKLTIQTNIASQSALSTYVQNDEGNSFSVGINGFSNYIVSSGPSLSSPRITVQQDGNTTFNASIDVANTIKTGSYTVATLPAGQTGMIATVTDATSITYRGTATGGGSDTVLVFFDGTNWIYH